MIKILLICPYESIYDKINRMIETVNPPDNICIVNQMNNGTAPDVVEKGDADIYIARGVTFLLMQKRLAPMPVIDIAVNGYDLLRALSKIPASAAGTTAMLLVAPQILCDLKLLQQFAGIDLRLGRIADEEDAERKVNEAVRQGVGIIIGGLTVCRICKRLGVEHIHIESGDESILGALNEAVRTAQAMNAERVKNQLIDSILQNSSEAIAAVNEKGSITAFNHKLYDVFAIRRSEDLAGRQMDDLLPNSGWRDIFSSCRPGEPSVCPTNRRMLYNSLPIMLDHQCIGVLFTFERIDKMQDTEKTIRNQLHQKGYVSKFTFSNILHQSVAMVRCLEKAYRYSQVDSNLLILGETGTGKEVLAHSIHSSSIRHSQPFVAINCAALPENLLESELFGYVEGAFSGASRGGKTGLFEQAHKGTVFLDEIGEMSLFLQAKLLRVLQEREIRRLGDNKIIPVDVRIIAATNLDLKEKIQKNTFRVDLYYRLNNLSLNLPPLRQRKDDIALLARHFVAEFAKKSRFAQLSITDEAIAILTAHTWPGNVRELQNVCERAAILSNTGIITGADVEDLIDFQNAASLSEDEPASLPYPTLSARKTKAKHAEQLGISRTTLWRREQANKQKKT